MARELKYTISGDPRDFNRALASVDRRLDASDRHARRFGSSLASTFRNVGHAAGYVGAAIGAGVVLEAKRAVTAFQESNKVAKQTQAVLKSTGRAAGVSARDVSHLATAISRKTGMDDEAIQSGENLLLTFTNIHDQAGKGNDIFTQTTRIMTDMSAALGQDTKASAIQLGKALNDPIKGVTALQRVGVAFTEDQKEQIKTLVESGKTMDAQKLILRELNTEFAGSAKAQATSTGKLKVAFGNLEEDIGSGLAPAVDKVANRLTEFAIDIEPKVIRAADRIAKTFGRKDLSLDQKFRLSARQATHVFQPLVDQAKKSIGQMRVGDHLEKAFVSAAPKIVDALAAAAPRAAGAFLNAFKNASPWGKVLTVAFLASKFGAFRGVGTWAAKTMIERMVAVFAADRALETAAGAAGTRGGGRFSKRFGSSVATKLRGFGSGGAILGAAAFFGEAVGLAIAAAVALKLTSEIQKRIPDILASGLPGGGPLGPAQIFNGQTFHAPSSSHGSGLIHNVNSHVNSPHHPGGDAVNAHTSIAGSSRSVRAHTSARTARNVQARTAGVTSTNSLEICKVICAQFGLTISSGYRTPEHNAAVNGVPNSWHTRGTPSNPGAVDMVGSTDAMYAALAWAKANVHGLAEAMVHDAGSGLHLHLAFSGASLSTSSSGGGGRAAARRAAAQRRQQQRRETQRRQRENHQAFVHQRRQTTRQHDREHAAEVRAHTPNRRERYEQTLADLDVAQGQAELTDTTSDDLKVLRRRRGVLKNRLHQINRLLRRKDLTVTQRRNLTDEKAGILGELGGIKADIGNIKTGGADGTADATQTLIDALKEVAAAQQADTALRAKIFGTQTGQIMAGIADMVSGELGGRIGLGYQTPGFAGGRARY